MTSNLAPDVVSTIVGAVVYRSDGAALSDILAAFPQAPERSEAQRWVTQLVSDGILDVDNSSGRRRYFATPAAAPYVARKGEVGRLKAEGAEGGGPEVLKAGGSGPAGQTTADGREERPRAAALPREGEAGQPAAVAGGGGAGQAGLEANGGSMGATRASRLHSEGQLGSAVMVDTSGSAEALFERLFAGELVGIVGKALSRDSASTRLWERANVMIADPAQRAAFVRYGEDRLAKLTLGECTRLNLSPAQFELWRRGYFAAKAEGERPEAEDDQGGESERPSAAALPEEGEGRAKGRKRAAKAAAPGPDLGQVVAPLLEAAVREAVGAKAAAPVSKAGGDSGGSSVALPAPVVASLTKAITAWIARAMAVKRSRNAVIVTVVAAVIVYYVMRTLGASSLSTYAATALVLLAGALAIGGVPATGANNATVTAGQEGEASGQGAGSRWKRIGLCVGAAVGALALVMFTWQQRVNSRPSPEAATAYLTSCFTPMPVRVAALDLTFQPATAAGTRVGFLALIETTEPLYRRIDTRDFLRTHAAAEMAAIDAASALLRGPSGTRLRAAISASAPTPAIDDLVLLAAQTPPHASEPVSGTLAAWKHDGTWTFMPEFGPAPTLRFAGEPKSALAAAIAVDSSADAARLKALLADHVAYAAKVRAAADAMAVDLERERQQRADVFARMLSPGALFQGTMTNTRRAETIPVVIEVVQSSAGAHRLTALLHNDGGWMDARVFRGEWSVAPDGETCTVNLRTQSSDAIADAGPLVQNVGDWPLNLELQADGSALAETFGRWQLHHVEAAAAPSVKSALTQPFASALAATTAGKVYHGMATRRTSSVTDETYSLRLRFTEQGTDGGLLRATLESLTPGGPVRRFNGLIVANTYRAADRPIRLNSRDSEKSAIADPKSPWGFDTHNNSFALDLRPDGDRLIGENRWFTYIFEPGDLTEAAPSTPATRSAAATARLDNSGAAAAGSTGLPTYPTLAGAYVLSDGVWKALPGQTVQTIRVAAAAVRSVTGLLGRLNVLHDTKADRAADAAEDVLLNLTFDSSAPVPAAAAKAVVIVYVASNSSWTTQAPGDRAGQASLAEVEMAPAKILPNGARTIPLVEVAPGLAGFGTDRLQGTIEHPGPGKAVFRASGLIVPGRYVVLCGGKGYEVAVE